MTPVLTGKDLVLEGSTTKMEDKQVPGVYIYIKYVHSIVVVGHQAQIIYHQATTARLVKKSEAGAVFCISTFALDIYAGQICEISQVSVVGRWREIYGSLLKDFLHWIFGKLTKMNWYIHWFFATQFGWF